MIIENLDTHCVIKWRLTDICNYHCPYCIRKPLVVKDYDVKKCEKKCLETLTYILQAGECLKKNTGKPLKVDLIGGEITVLPNLDKIVNGLLKGADKVNITTNFWKSLDYIANPKVSVTVSYHPSQTKETLDAFLDRCAKEAPNFGNWNCETVALANSTHIEAFIKGCESRGLKYKVEEDLFDPNCKGKACSSTKPTMRYRVTDDKGITKEFPTRNMFLKQYGINGTVIDTLGHLCSRDFDYLYFEQDEAWYCFGKKPAKKFVVAEEPHPCHKRAHMCTLCGNISIYELPRTKLSFD